MNEPTYDLGRKCESVHGCAGLVRDDAKPSTDNGKTLCLPCLVVDSW